MSQCQKNCNCDLYDNVGDHRSALIKMELPEYDESYGSTSYTIYRAIRFVGYVVVLVFLSYSLWRIHVIESTLLARDRFANVSKIIALGNSEALHRRMARSIEGTSDLTDKNAFEMEKDLARGGMITSKNEMPLPAKKKVKSKEDFNDLVNTLFDAIQRMHNDSDRSHFDRNMKAVFHAWFPVFDALLPGEFTADNDEVTRNTRSIDKSSEESSEEKKEKQAKGRQVRLLMSTSDESSEEQVDNNEENDVAVKSRKKLIHEKKVVDNNNEQKNSDESSEENSRRKRTLYQMSNEDSSKSGISESYESKKIRQLQTELNRCRQTKFVDRGVLPARRMHEKESSESSDSSDESSEKNKNRNEYKKYTLTPYRFHLIDLISRGEPIDTQQFESHVLVN